jgi:hypothetical protein
MHGRDDFPPPPEESLARLRRSGWSLGETAFFTEVGGVVYQVDGSNGENKILVRGATAREAWWRAIEAAAAVGMLVDWPRPSGKVE